MPICGYGVATHSVRSDRPIRTPPAEVSEESGAAWHGIEALTSRFAGLDDFPVQRVFRTLDQIELLDEGTPLDRLQRAEARQIIPPADRRRESRMLHDAMAHEHLIESADRVLPDALTSAPELVEATRRVLDDVHTKG